MKWLRGFALCFVAIAALGCRQILGIHETSVATGAIDGGDGGADAMTNTDQGSADLAEPSTNDLAGTDLSPPVFVPSNPTVSGGFVSTGKVLTIDDDMFDTDNHCSADSILGDCATVTYADGVNTIPYCVCKSDELTIKSLRVVGSNNGLVLVVSKRVTITAELDASANGPNPGPGAIPATTTEFHASGGSFGSTGGFGPGATEWPVRGNPELEPLVGGQDGDSSCSTSGWGGGGKGGGAVQISAGESITVAAGAYVESHGGGGAGGAAGYSCSAGGGGGSGGAILLEAPTLKILGFVSANGGAGGGGASDVSYGNDGGKGRTGHVALGGEGRDGSGCPLFGYITGGDGGDGATGTQSATSGESGDSDCNCTGSCNAVGPGGGGGGVGRIRFNYTKACQCSGTFSPSVSYGAPL